MTLTSAPPAEADGAGTASDDGIDARPPVWRRLAQGRYLADAATAIVLGVFVFGCAGVAVLKARLFDGIPFDGAFQLFNPLRRIAAGQVPGQDFVFFHGIGVPYLHLPIYWLAGGGLFGSELSRQVVTPVLFILGAYVVVRAAASSRRQALRLLAMVIAVGSLLRLDLLSLVADGSLIGVRSFMPLLAVATLAAALRRSGPGPQWTRFALVGVLCGAAFLCGTEHGLAFGVALAIVLLSFGGGTFGRRVLRLGYVAACGAAFAGATLFAVTGGRPAAVGALLRYAFVDVPGDQFWYFGAPPNGYVDSLTDLFSSPTTGVFMVWGVVTLGLALRGCRNGTVPRWAALCAMVLSIYGMMTFTAHLGISATVYLVVGLRAFGLATIFLLVRHPDPNTAARSRLAVPGLRLARPAAVAGVILLTAGLVSTNLGPAAIHLPGNTRALLTQGPKLSQDWRQYMGLARSIVGPHHCDTPSDAHLWATYSGLLHADLGCFNPGADYTIHALGTRNRARYVAAFRAARPDYVETMRREAFKYEDWLRYNTWDFYRELFTGYEPAGITAHSILWRRGSPGRGLRLGPPRQAVLTSGGSILIKPPATCDLLSIDVRFRADDVLRSVPVIGDLNRHLVAIRGTRADLQLALDPKAGHATFPVLVRANRRPVLITPLVMTLVPGARMALTEVSWRCGTLPATRLWRDAVFGGERPLAKLPEYPGPRLATVGD